MRILRYTIAVLALALLALATAIFSKALRPTRVKFAREIAAVGLATSARPGPVLSEADISSLPLPVQRLIDGRGAPRDFSTTDRFLEDPYDPKHPLIRARWTTPIAGWQMVEGRQIPTSGKAVWHLPQGDFAYVEIRFLPESVAYNVLPGE